MPHPAPARPHGEDDRVYRVAAAVALVERGHPTGGRVSVRKAASMYGLPKSTVHRYIQANRGVEVTRRRSPKRGRVAPPKKCGIQFLLADDDSPPPRPTPAHASSSSSSKHSSSKHSSGKHSSSTHPASGSYGSGAYGSGAYGSGAYGSGSYGGSAYGSGAYSAHAGYGRPGN